MAGEQLDAVLKSVSAKSAKDGFSSLPEGVTITLYLAHEGSSLSVPKVDAVKTDGDLVHARTVKKETFVFAKADIFAVATDGSATVAGESPRRAGFGG